MKKYEITQEQLLQLTQVIVAAHGPAIKAIEMIKSLRPVDVDIKPAEVPERKTIVS